MCARMNQAPQRAFLPRPTGRDSDSFSEALPPTIMDRKLNRSRDRDTILLESMLAVLSRVAYNNSHIGLTANYRIYV